MEATAAPTWQSTSGVSRQCIRLLPSLTDVAFILPLVLLFGVRQGTQVLFFDGDTGWHIRTGEWILRHGAVPRTDLFSFTKPGQPWFAWEWGWELLFGWIHSVWGLAGVALATIAILGAVSALVFRLIRRESGNDVLALVITAVFVSGSTGHWLARPHLTGWLLLAIFYYVLLSARPGNTRPLWYLPGLTLVWTNVHGSFFVGILLVSTWCLGSAIEEALRPGFRWPDVWKRSAPYALCGVACAASTFVNPYGWHLHQHIFEYLRDSRQLDQINEFLSPNFHHGGAIFFECMLLLGGTSVYWCLRRKRIAAAITTVLWAHFALISVRNAAIFILLAAPWVAAMLHDVLGGEWRQSWALKIRRELTSIWEDFRPFERVERWHLASGLALLTVGLLLTSHLPNFEPRFDSNTFPERALPTLMSWRGSRIFTFDQWGDFLIYRLNRKVFVDGRSDFYGADFEDQIGYMVNARYDWKSYFDRFAIDTVLLRPDAPLCTVLKQSVDWRVLFDDGRAIVFGALREPMQPRMLASADFPRISPVFPNGGNELRVSGGSQVQGSSSRLIINERRNK